MRRSLAGAGLTCLLVGSCAAEINGRSKTAYTRVDTTSNQIGRVTSSGAGGLRVYYQYDPRGRPTATQHALETAGYVFTTTYGDASGAPNGAGRYVVGETFSDGEAKGYGYDAGGGQQSISAAGQSIVRRVLRNVRGQTVQVDYGDGTTTIHAYNDGGDLSRRWIVTRSSGTTLQAYGYQTDANRNVLAVNDYCDAPAAPNQASVGCCDPSQDVSCQPKPLSAAYGYDSLDRLTSMNGNPWYAYDASGNLTSKEGQAQSYGAGAGPHALTQAGARSFSYDANGNATQAGTTSFAWDPNNMPIRVSDGTTTIDKQFFGEAVWKKVEGGVTTYYLPSERIENGKLRKLYGSFGERDPDDGDALKFYHGDHLGSSTLVTKAGVPIFRAAHYPYGEQPDGSERFDNASMPYSPTTHSPKHKFNFKEKDALGFYDYGARLYDPRTGRFLSADTSTGDGPNRYAYVRNNPLRFIDPTGHLGLDGGMIEYEYKAATGKLPPASPLPTLHDVANFLMAGPRNFIDGFGCLLGATCTTTHDQLVYGGSRVALHVAGSVLGGVAASSGSSEMVILDLAPARLAITQRQMQAAGNQFVEDVVWGNTARKVAEGEARNLVGRFKEVYPAHNPRDLPEISPETGILRFSRGWKGPKEPMTPSEIDSAMHQAERALTVDGKVRYVDGPDGRSVGELLIDIKDLSQRPRPIDPIPH
jgi:RHS repeat-associated protein